MGTGNSRSLRVVEVVKNRDNFELMRKVIGKEQLIEEQYAMVEFGNNIYAVLEKIMDKMIELGKLPEKSRDQFLTLSCLKFLSGGVVAFKEFEKVNGFDLTDFINQAVDYVTYTYIPGEEKVGAYTNGLSSEAFKATQMADLKNYIEALKAGKSFTADNGLTIISKNTFTETLWLDYIVTRYLRVWSFKKFGILFDDNTLLRMYMVANHENTNVDVVVLTGGSVYLDDKSQLVFRFKDEEGEKLLETGVYSFEDFIVDVIDYHNNVLMYAVISSDINEFVNDLIKAGNTQITSVDDLKAYYSAHPDEGYFDDTHVYTLVAYFDFDNEFGADVHGDDIRQGVIKSLGEKVAGSELVFGNATLIKFNGIDFRPFVVTV